MRAIYRRGTRHDLLKSKVSELERQLKKDAKDLIPIVLKRQELEALYVSAKESEMAIRARIAGSESLLRSIKLEFE